MLYPSVVSVVQAEAGVVLQQIGSEQVGTVRGSGCPVPIFQVEEQLSSESSEHGRIEHLPPSQVSHAVLRYGDVGDRQTLVDCVRSRQVLIDFGLDFDNLACVINLSSSVEGTNRFLTIGV